MYKLKILVLAMCFSAITVSSIAELENNKKSLANIQSQEMIATIVSVDLQNATMDLQYEFDDQTRQTKIDAFYVTDATIIDISAVKSGLKDLKVGMNIFVEYAQMSDGAKVVESVWVKKS